MYALHGYTREPTVNSAQHRGILTPSEIRDWRVDVSPPASI